MVERRGSRWVWAVVCGWVALGGVGASEARADALERGYTLLRNGKPNEAERVWRAALAQTPTRWTLHLALGELALDARQDCATAEPHLRVVLERAPALPEVLEEVEGALLGCYEARGAWDAAAEVLVRRYATLKQLRRHEDARVALRRRGRALLRARRYAEAERVLTRVIVDNGSDAEAFTLRAHARLRQGRAEAALDDYRLVRLRFEAPWMLLHSGVALVALKRHRDALRAFRRSLHEDGPALETWRWIAWSHQALDEWDKAEAAWRACLAFDLSDPAQGAEVWNNLAWALVMRAPPRSPRLVEALRYAQHAVEATHRREALYMDTLAEVLLRLGRPGEALRWSRAAVRLEPEDAALWAQLARMKDAASGWRSRGGRVRMERWRAP